MFYILKTIKKEIPDLFFFIVMTSLIIANGK